MAEEERALVPEPEDDQPIYVNSADQLKRDIDAFLEVRAYLAQRISEVLVEGVDYHIIEVGGKRKKSLGKPGAEKIAAIMQFTVPVMNVDKETMEALDLSEPFIAYQCQVLNRHGSPLAVGRGARFIRTDGGDVNKAVKMAQKSCYIDGVIRASGMSDVFTQDLEDMNLVNQSHGRPVSTQRTKPRAGKSSSGGMKPTQATTDALRDALTNPLLTEMDIKRYRAVLKFNRTEEDWQKILLEIQDLAAKREYESDLQKEEEEKNGDEN